MDTLRLLTLFFLLCTLNLTATEIQWTGTTSNNWSNVNNWDCNCLPGPSDDISIPNGDVVTLDTDATVRSLTSRGDLLVTANRTLTIDGQMAGAVTGLWHIIGTLINNGTIVITGMLNKEALESNNNALMINNGEVSIIAPACMSDDCSGSNALTISGILINNGNWTIQNPQFPDAMVIFGELENNGLLLIDNAEVLGTVLGFGQDAIFTNSSDGVCRLENIMADGNLVRGLKNSISNTTMVNDGLLRIHTAGDNLRCLDLVGDNSTFINRGTLEIEGGQFGIELRSRALFSNEGDLQLTGQAEEGANLRSGATVLNSGTWNCSAGNVRYALQLIGNDEDRPHFENTGSFTVNDYLGGTTLDRAILHSGGDFLNEGTVELEGNNMGLAWEAGADSLYNTATGVIRLSKFQEGLRGSDQAINQGILLFGPELAQGFDNAILHLRNSGIIGGSTNLEVSAIELLNGSTFSPGEETTIGELLMVGDFNLSADNSIVLDIGPNGTADKMTTFNSIDFSGDLTVRLASNFMPTEGTYTLLSTGTGFTGTPNVLLPSLPTNWLWEVEQTGFELLLHLMMVNSTEEFTASSAVRIYPNPIPSNGPFTVEFGTAFKSQNMELRSINGALLSVFPLQTQQSTIQLPALPVGVYILSANGWRKRLLIL